MLFSLFTVSIGPFTLAKTKIKKICFFVVPFTLPEKPITFCFFWQEKHMREKARTSYCFFCKWCACATSLYLSLTVRSAQYVAGRGWFRRRSRPTWPKTRIIPVRGERAFTLAKKNSEKPAEFQKTTLRRWVFLFRFFAVFRGSCLATSNENECEKKTWFFYATCKRLALVKVLFFKLKHSTRINQ